MTRAHTPPSSTPPPEPSGGGEHTDSRVDLVAGDPPVPITVWRTPAGDDQASVPPRLAERLVIAYSQPGETVIDLTDDHALADVTVRGARRHHKGWFTDASALIIGPPTPPGADADRPGGVGSRPSRRRRRQDVDPPGLAAWFGDDLTDPDLPPHQPHRIGPVGIGTTSGIGVGSIALPGVDTVVGATSLVVACWPLHAVDGRNRRRLRWLLHGGVRLLRPAGCLVLVVRPPAGSMARPEGFGPLVGPARDAGLGYLQHIVAVRADVAGDQFVYYATDDELLALARDAERWKVAHLRVHADLLVFSPQSAPAGGGVRG